jgi:AcrR family transcriptional regulator
VEDDDTVQADDVAARILDAAFEQFCLVGIRRSSMEDVARRAKVGRVTIYRKFASNEKLVAALLRRETQAAIATVEKAVRDIADVETRFVEGFVAGMHAVRRHPLILALIATEPERALPMLTVQGSVGLALARGFMASEIRRAQKSLGIPQVDADQIAEILARLTHSLVLTPQTCLPLDDDKRMREFARRHIVPMVTGRAPRPR